MAAEEEEEEEEEKGEVIAAAVAAEVAVAEILAQVAAAVARPGGVAGSASAPRSRCWAGSAALVADWRLATWQ